MDESLFKVERDHRGLLRIIFAHEIRPGPIAEFLQTECGARPVKAYEDPLGDCYDVHYRIGFSSVCLASDSWMLMLLSNSRWSDRAISRIARRLAVWQPPAAKAPPA